MLIVTISSVLALPAYANDCASGKSMGDRMPLKVRLVPLKHIFRSGQPIVVNLSIRNETNKPLFVSRLAGKDFIDIHLSGPGENKEVRWVGKGKIDSKAYSPSEFTVLKAGEETTASRTISTKAGEGFVIEKQGKYFIRATYSLGPSEYFAPMAGDAKIPQGCFESAPTTFCLDSCNASDK